MIMSEITIGKQIFDYFSEINLKTSDNCNMITLYHNVYLKLDAIEQYLYDSTIERLVYMDYVTRGL